MFKTVLCIISLLLVLFSNALSATQEELFNLAVQMTELTPLTEEGVTPSLRKRVKAQDAEIEAQFNSLTIGEKHAVYRYIRQINTPENQDEFEETIYSLLNKAAKLAEQDELYFGDLSEAKMEEYMIQVFLTENPNEAQNTRRARWSWRESCGYGYFPIWMPKKEPYSRSYTYSTDSVNKIRNTDERFCDWEVHFPVSRARVWGTSPATRQLLIALDKYDTGGGLHKRETYNSRGRRSDHLLLGGGNT